MILKAATVALRDSSALVVTVSSSITGTDSHFGATIDTFTPGTEGYIAFVLNPDTTPLYGWMRVTLENDGTPGVIHDWAYSETSIIVGVPEPSALLLLLLASPGLLLRRRRLGACFR